MDDSCAVLDCQRPRRVVAIPLSHDDFPETRSASKSEPSDEPLGCDRDPDDLHVICVLRMFGSEFFRSLLQRFTALRSPDHSGMEGRVFDLSKRQLVRLRGFRLFVLPGDFIGRSIMLRQTYESHVTAVVRRMLQPGDVFLDVGANLGYFTLLACSLGAGRVIAVEPNPQNLELIQLSIAENRFSRVRIVPFAASDQDATLRFVTVGSNGGVLTERFSHQAHSLLVRSVVLDDFLIDEPRIDFVKIDVEAHEPAAIRGMVELIGRHRPTIITEFHPWAMELNISETPESYLHQLRSLGYSLGIIRRSGKILSMDEPSAIMAYWRAMKKPKIHLDLLCVPE